MCGIIGYKGQRNASEILLNGIKSLEYRGYDSVGMVTLNKNRLEVRKDKGNVDEVNEKLNFLEMRGKIGIAHSRWSTHGVPSRENAHPHISSDGNIAVVHNGIIENYALLKSRLQAEGYRFSSQTDTEVIPMLIEKLCKNHAFEEAVRLSLKELEGTFAIVVLNKNSNMMIAARRASPLVLGIGNDEYFLASDVPAFLQYTKKVIFIDDNEMVMIDDNLNIINFQTEKNVKKNINIIEWEFEQAQKGEFEHFMLKEIYEQPKAIQETFMDRIKNDKIVFEDLGLREESFKKIKRILMVACGTSWHACLIGKFMIESLAKISVEVDYASEFRYRNPIVNETDLIIAISQSGETADTLAAIREARSKGAKVLSVCNVVGSSIPRESDGVIYTRAGPEIGVASTKAFISQITVLYLLGIYLAQIYAAWPEEHLKDRINSLKKIPEQIKYMLDKKNDIIQCAEKHYSKLNALYLGRGTNYPIALEGALKLKEVSYIHAEGYPAAEMKHGPIALIDNKMPVVVIAVKDDSYVKIKGNIQEIRSRGGIVISIATEGDEDIKKQSDHVIYIPKTSGLLYPFLTVVPLQLFAYYVAKERECDIDKPRSLAKCVTVE